ncbi:MAG: SH3 domain-containing protein [Turicibacter sp.]|nr:SH3 domain-containing protein [Turicibacter sp.]
MSKQEPHFDNEHEAPVSNHWTSKIGAGFIALLTIIGFALILYTGARTALYQEPQTEEPAVIETPEPEETDDNVEDAVKEETTDEGEADKDGEDEDASGAEDEDELITATDSEVPGITNVSGAFIRSEPEPGASILAQLPLNTEVSVTGVDATGNWLQVEYDGNTGYIFSEFIDLSDED